MLPAALVMIPVVAIAALLWVLRESLPRRDGATELSGLAETVRVELDVHAVPRLRAASLEDALSAQGFMHAQERYFQMDLARRSAAGELAALVGPVGLATDRARRPYEFRARAAALLRRLPARHRGWLDAYVRGVNAGLRDLRRAPPEYLLLGEQPHAWTSEDTLLVVFAIYTMLSNNENYERPQAVMRAVLEREVYDFLTPSVARFDRPLLFPPEDRTGGYVPAPVPGPEVLDLRSRSVTELPRGIVDPPLTGPASNQWASGAARSSRGDALLANDPHLELRVPNLFYRAELYWPGRVARGASIAGLPGILIGASESLAWGATVSNADQSDWIVVIVDADDPARYRTPRGFARFGTAAYELEVAGAPAPERLEVPTTEWGPVIDEDGLGRPLVLEATWLAERGVNLAILDLMLADSVAAGLGAVERWAGPSLNWMLADSAGAVGWAVNGPLPRRVGFDGSVPEPRTEAVHWNGTQPAPRSGPQTGTLFTANSRTLPRAQALPLSRMWMRPLRAQRIDELLSAGERFSEQDFLAMQLDTRARGYEPMRDLVLETVAADESDAALAWARRAAETWNGRADADEHAFRLLHGYYRALLERVLGPLLAPAAAADPQFRYRWPLADEPLMRLLEERPAHLLAPEYAGWPALLRVALEESLARLDAQDQGLAASWGEANRLDVGHPFAAIPVVGRFLKLPAHEQPGSLVSLRVAAPSYGAALRMIVSPANPSAGSLQMPGGQSGHFLSRNFSDLHADWAIGAPTPFLAGPTHWQFKLEPLPVGAAFSRDSALRD